LKNGKTDLPSEILEGLNAYHDQCQRLQTRKTERGYDYAPYTTRRRQRDAADFCAFLASIGIRYWAEISQRHFDAYITERSPMQGSRVYPFVRFILSRFKLTCGIKSPRIRRRVAISFVIDPDDMPPIVRRVASIQATDTRLVGILLSVYGQPISRSVELRMSHFRWRKERIEALFAESWMPLDSWTGDQLLQWCPALTTPVSAVDDRLFFRPASAYRTEIAHVTQCNAKAVRCGAVARILRSGLAQRRMMKALFGVSMNTVQHIEGTFEADFQQTVDSEVVGQRNRVIRGEHGN
jgi:hypothetical protein